MKRPYFTRWWDGNGYGFTLWAGNGYWMMQSRQYKRASSAWRALRRINAEFGLGEELTVYDAASL